MSAELISPLVERAMRVAAEQHRLQNRKSTKLPYISHPASVALILQRAGFDDENVLAAALLHDVVEDTGYSLEALRQKFPAKVVEYVMALSERKRDDKGQKRPWIDRKKEHIAHAPTAPLEARAILLADKLHNLFSIVFDLETHGAEVWGRFNAGPRDLLWYHREMVKAASHGDPRLEKLAAACTALIDRLEQSLGNA